MPRKSVYFPDEQLERAMQAAAADDRSFSKWVQRAIDRALTAEASQLVTNERKAKKQ